jgi:hypothetical protein
MIIGIVFFVLRRSSKNRLLWNSVSKNLNLNMPNPKKLEMSGFYNGCEVKLSIGARRSSDSTEYFTYCLTEFSHPFRLLLKISSPKGIISKVFGTAQSNFERTFNVECYDANVLQRLLLSDFPSNKTQNLMGDLMLANQSIQTINITDKKVYTETSGQTGDENTLRQMLEITTYLANRFKMARENFPLADWEKSLLENWQSLSNEANLQFDSKNMQIRGNYHNFPLFIALETEKGIWQTEIKLKFPQSLMIGLKIMPENSIHKALTWVGLQDIEVGIREFDDAFIVKGKNIQMAKHKLQPDVCRQLIELRRRVSEIAVNDDEISVTFDEILGDKTILKNYLEGIVSTARMLLR